MKYILLLILSFGMISCAHSHSQSKKQTVNNQKIERSIAQFKTNESNEKIYESAQGNMSVTKLEKELSKKLNGAEILITKIRWSANPFDYGAYFIGKMLKKTFASYIINFKLNSEHSVRCDFIPFIEKERIMVNHCVSLTAGVYIPGFIYYKDIGL